MTAADLKRAIEIDAQLKELDKERISWQLCATFNYRKQISCLNAGDTEIHVNPAFIDFHVVKNSAIAIINGKIKNLKLEFDLL